MVRDAALRAAPHHEAGGGRGRAVLKIQPLARRRGVGSHRLGVDRDRVERAACFAVVSHPLDCSMSTPQVRNSMHAST